MKTLAPILAILLFVSAVGAIADPSSPKEALMRVHYLEIVTDDVTGTITQYEAAFGVMFGEPVAELGNARTTELAGGHLVSVRAPMHEQETPVIRPYWLVDDIAAAVKAAEAAGAMVAHLPLEIPGIGTFAITISGGNQHGFWQK